MTPIGHGPTRRDWSRLPAAAFHLALAGLVLALGMILVWNPILGAHDFWAHAGVGRWITENGRVPDRSLFLWTADEPWVYHSWLTQLLFYNLTRISTPETLARVVLGFTTFFALTPFVLAWWVWGLRARFTCVMALPFVVALDAIGHRFQPRPELFTAFFLSLLLVYLTRRADPPGPDRPTRSTRRRIVEAGVVLGLFSIWANLHGAVVIGVQVFFVTAVGDFLQNRRDGHWKFPAVLAILAPIAVCVNPYGPTYWLALRPVGSYRFSTIVEWFPVWRNPDQPEAVIIAAVLLPALATLAWVLNPERRWAQLGWLVMFATMYVLARRNIWPFAIVCLMMLAANARSLDLESIWSRLSRMINRRAKSLPPPAFLRWALRVFVMLWLLLHAWPVFADFRPWTKYTPTRLEKGIVRFVGEQQLEGRVFNDYENSSYFQWRFAGRPSLYIDLLNAYPDQVGTDYLEIAQCTDHGLVLLDEQRIGFVILTTNRGPWLSLGKLADYLDASPGWARVYMGGDGVVWVRRTTEYEHVWRAFNGSVQKTRFRPGSTEGNRFAVK